MLELTQLPEVASGDLVVGVCTLEVKQRGSASSAEEAWKLLPNDGRGIVVLADRVVTLEETGRRGLLVEAEVVSSEGTTLLRMDGGTWRAWTWSEKPGESHRYMQRRFRSSRPAIGGEPPDLIYRQYWARQAAAEGVAVWQPVGSCLVGFEEDGR